MKRKQIYIDEEQERDLKREAGERRVSEASLIRDAIESFLRALRPNPSLGSMKDHPLAGIIGIGKSEVTDGSVNHDFYLYGAPREEE